jgi:hypothetical protein
MKDIRDQMKEKVMSLHPTQIAVGYQQVAEKYERLDKKSKKDLQEYLETHHVPVVKGYDNKLFIIDHHHLCCALHRIDPDFKVYIDIVVDLSHLSYIDFWKTMYEKKYVWLYDENGKELSLEEFPRRLPGNILGLQNDPYRAMAGVVRKLGAYEKDWTPFAEFTWANFLRNKVHLDPKDVSIRQFHEEDIKKAFVLIQNEKKL